MIITRLEIRNFKALKSVEVDLDPKANVFAGVNGAGKSTLIAAVHLMFLRYVSAMRTGRAIGRSPTLKELSKGAETVHLSIAAKHGTKRFGWHIDKTFSGLHSQKTEQDLEELRDFIQIQLEQFEDPERAKVPVFTTYPVSRSVIDVPVRVRNKDDTSPASAFQSTALSTARNFRSFFGWFRDREDYENERRLEDRRFEDPQLSAVRTAVGQLMPGFTDLRVKRRPLRMVVMKGSVEFDVDSLSDGEKGVLALAGDLARRISLANPGLDRPLQGTGIVLIDEIELHLHPAWQRNAVHGLCRAFPNIQFIFTTHSPQVLSELQAEQIFLLVDGSAVSVGRSYGMDSTQILRELMGDPGRPVGVSKQIDTLYGQLESGDLSKSEEGIEQLASSIGPDDPVVTLARSKLRRAKVLRDRETHK